MFTLLLAALMTTSAPVAPDVTVDCTARTVTATVTVNEPDWAFAVQDEPPLALGVGQLATITQPLTDNGSYTVVMWQFGTGAEWGGTFPGCLDLSPPAGEDPAPRVVVERTPVVETSPELVQPDPEAWAEAVQSFVSACVAMAGVVA